MCWGGVEHAQDNLETRGHDVTLLFSMFAMRKFGSGPRINLGPGREKLPNFVTTRC